MNNDQHALPATTQAQQEVRKEKIIVLDFSSYIYIIFKKVCYLSSYLNEMRLMLMTFFYIDYICTFIYLYLDIY